jgi:hypothetical protein
VTLNSRAIFAAVESHAETLAIFDRVGKHEPKNAPGNGLTCAIWAAPIRPIPAASGLAAMSVRLELMVRIYNPMLQQPLDDIDPTVLDAVDALLGAYAGAFTLGGIVRDVDLLGQHGTSLSAVPGYLTQDSKLFRVMDITLPLILNDLWNEAA